MLRKPLRLLFCWLVVLSTAISSGVFIYAQEMATAATWDSQQAISGSTTITIDPIDFLEREKPAPITAKGIYLTAYSAGNKKKMDAIIDLLTTTELNTVVIDIKDYSGKVLYDSKIKLINDLQIDENRLGNVRALIKRLHQHNIYVIARQTVFQDPMLASKKPDWAIKSKAGGIWRDNKGLSWVDPTRKEVWEYNVAIAKEAIKLGFDEINFDYVRFPSDGAMSQVVYTIGNKKRYEVMGDFFRFIGEELKDEPAWISIDVFGLTMEATGANDMRIGQRIVDALDHVDYICPMMYPSHYPAGHLKLNNPAASPGLVIENGMKKGAAQFKGKRAKLRPWLQAFHLGAHYGADKIRAQIAMTEKYTDDGWLLWNAANRYTEAGLKKEE